MSNSGDRKGNITAAFGSDLTLEGMTAVPNLLLKYYPKIGITDSEMMLIIQLMHLQTSTNQHFPALDVVAEHMSGDNARIKADLASLIEKGIISIKHYYCESTDEVEPFYSYEPLFEKISEFWACEKVKTYQQMKKSLKGSKNKQSETGRGQPGFAKAAKAFEKEFGRLLSPMEIEQINLWLDDSAGSLEMVMEALKRAVMLGKHNFKYIDSILLEWQRNNLKSISDVLVYEAGFRERQTGRSAHRNQIQTGDKKTVKKVEKKDKFRLLYLG